MVTARRVTISAAGLLCLLALAAPSPVAEVPDNWQRLRAMPPELRSQLAAQLKEFDLLNRDEKEAIRALDQKIAAEPEESRQLDYAVMQRYHAWVQGLTETQRTQLAAAPRSKRMALVTRIVADRKARSGVAAEPSVFHYADFGGASPFDLAERIKAWFSLSDAQKDEVLKLEAAERPRALTRLIREKKIRIERPTASKLDEVYQRASASGRFPLLKKAEEKKQATVKNRFVDNYWFVENPPAKVGPDRLLQFEQALPPWVRGGFDMLPPDEARRRLTILYRLVFGKGEIGAGATPAGDKAKAAAKAAPSPAPPATPKATGSKIY